VDYVADTVAFVRFVTGSKKIGKTALDLMLSANEIGTSRIILSAVSLMEIMYLAEKGRIPLKLEDTLDKLAKHPSFSVVPLDENIVRAANSCQGLELHDRLIVATAKYLKAPLLTCDQVIIGSKMVKTIWA
jgi:PIN domain nuclease of toxin-antitoxin system